MYPLVFLLGVAAPITITSILFPAGKDTGSDVPQRPPGYVFGIVWPLLYILIAISWWTVKDWKMSYILYPLLIFMLCLWLVLYKKSKIYGLWCLLATWTISLGMIISLSFRSETAAWTFLPLVGWLLTASLLNFRAIENTQK
jgi:tryptophan-rich sensory protein